MLGEDFCRNEAKTILRDQFLEPSWNATLQLGFNTDYVHFSHFLHYRLTILPPEEKLVPMFDRISKFHKEFMNKYRDGNDNDKPPQ